MWKREHRLLETKEDEKREGLSVVTELIDENTRPEESLLTYCKNKEIDLIIVGRGNENGEKYKDGSLVISRLKYQNIQTEVLQIY